MATRKKSPKQKVILELELTSDKVEALKPLIKNDRLQLVLGKNSFIASKSIFIACNHAFYLRAKLPPLLEKQLLQK